MNRKIIYALFVFSIFLLVSCKKKDYYQEINLIVFSRFDTDSFEIVLPAIDLEDGEKTANYFYSKLSIDEISQKYNYLEKEDKYIRYFSNSNYYYLQFISREDNKNKYKLISDSAVYNNNGALIEIRFPRNICNIISNDSTFDDEQFSYLETYYDRIGIQNSDNTFIVNCFDKINNKEYSLLISKTNGVKLVDSND